MNSQEEIYERLELSVARLGDIRDEMSGCKNEIISESYRSYFITVSDFILSCYDLLMVQEEKLYKDLSFEELKGMNYALYQDILPENYGESL